MTLLLLCRLGWHALEAPGNCMRCGYRGHGGHVGTYEEWESERIVKALFGLSAPPRTPAEVLDELVRMEPDRSPFRRHLKEGW